MFKIFTYFINIIFPISCIVCRKDCGVWLCGVCEQNIIFSLKKQSYKNISFPIFTLFEHSSSMRKMVYALKYKYYTESAVFFQKYIDRALKNVVGDKSFVLVPVPIHRSRKKERGFDHIKVLIGKRSNILETKRVHYKSPQMKLNKMERQENIKGAFSCDEVLDDNITYVIFDDVVTSGSTMKELVNVLYRSGARDIVGVALSRGL